MTTTPDFRTELARLVDLYEALGGNWSPHGYTDTWNDALVEARAALATEPVWEGLSIDDIRQLCVDNELLMFVDSGDFDTVVVAIMEIVCAALARWGRPATPPPEPLRPIPVSERLPGPGDCAPWPGEPDATPWCWAGRRNDGGWEWRQGLSAKSLSWCIAGGGWSHWLPYNAIPFPEVTQ